MSEVTVYGPETMTTVLVCAPDDTPLEGLPELVAERHPGSWKVSQSAPRSCKYDKGYTHWLLTLTAPPS